MSSIASTKKLRILITREHDSLSQFLYIEKHFDDTHIREKALYLSPNSVISNVQLCL